MSELKPCPMEPKQAAEKLQESYDYMTHVMPEGKRSQATIDLLAAMFCAISVCRAQPANDPLTLEQLREMHGQPVWVVPNRGIAKWYLVDVANDCCSTCDMDVVDFELYGPKDKSYGWLAYRRPPEMFISVDLASGHDFTAYGRPPERSENDG